MLSTLTQFFSNKRVERGTDHNFVFETEQKWVKIVDQYVTYVYIYISDIFILFEVTK